MSNLDVVHGVKRQTLNQSVYQSIKTSILNGSLKENTKLSEQQLAANLGVSATPVREAFRMLAAEGLVKMEPWKGVVVQGFSDEDALEAMQCREALECQAMRLVFDRLTEEDFNTIGGLLQQARNTDTCPDFVAISANIHNIWVQGCGNKRLIAMMKQLDDVLFYASNISAVDAVRSQQIINEHTEILAAMRAHDLQRATEALSAHLHNGYEYSIKKHTKRGE